MKKNTAFAPVSARYSCHTQAQNPDALMQRVREVIQLCLSS
jgi:hypothetical protein